MDNLGHEHNTEAEPFQDSLCLPLDHEELFSAHGEDQLAEQWMVRKTLFVRLSRIWTNSSVIVFRVEYASKSTGQRTV